MDRVQDVQNACGQMRPIAHFVDTSERNAEKTVKIGYCDLELTNRID
jgi:hypothetical protein